MFPNQCKPFLFISLPPILHVALELLQLESDTEPSGTCNGAEVT